MKRYQLHVSANLGPGMRECEHGEYYRVDDVDAEIEARNQCIRDLLAYIKDAELDEHDITCGAQVDDPCDCCTKPLLDRARALTGGGNA